MFSLFLQVKSTILGLSLVPLIESSRFSGIFSLYAELSVIVKVATAPGVNFNVLEFPIKNY